MWWQTGHVLPADVIGHSFLGRPLLPVPAVAHARPAVYQSKVFFFLLIKRTFQHRTSAEQKKKIDV